MSLSDWAQLFTKREGLTNRISIELYDNRIYFEVGNGANTYGVTQSSLLKKDEWHYYTFVYDGTALANEDKLKIYVDGTEKNLLYAGDIPSVTGENPIPFTLGNPEANPEIEITDIRVWDKSLTADEIAIRKQFQLSGNEEGLVYYLKTEEEADSALINESVNNAFTVHIAGYSPVNRKNELLGFMLYSCESERWNVGNLITDISQLNSDDLFTLAPNPAGKSVRIVFHIADKSEKMVRIYDLSGRLVFSKYLGVAGKLTYPLNIAALKKGYYIVELRSGKRSFRQSLVVQ